MPPRPSIRRPAPAVDALNASQQSAADSADDVAAQQQNVANAISDAELRIQDIIAAYKDAYDEAYGSISGSMRCGILRKRSFRPPATSINNALQSQITYWDNYNQNLEKLNERAADIDGLSEVIASFADGSKESVNAIAGMASASDADLAKMVENYAALKEAQDTTSESIADLKTGMSNSMDEIAKTVADTVSEMDMSDEATKSAKETIQGFIDGASSMMPVCRKPMPKSPRRPLLRWQAPTSATMSTTESPDMLLVRKMRLPALPSLVSMARSWSTSTAGNLF